jgi:hypothetical protein
MALERATPNYLVLKAGVQELAEGPADKTAIEAKLGKLSQEDIPKEVPNALSWQLILSLLRILLSYFPRKVGLPFLPESL